MIIAEGLICALRELGYEVTEPASNYTEALEMISKEMPDLLLVDITLGGSKDGIDLAWIIKERFNIPFIYLSANSDKATVSRAKETEPPAYLIKPFSKDELYTSIEICLHNFSKQQSREKAYLEGSYPLENSVFIKEGNIFHKVKFNEILYLESEHVYVNIYTVHRKILVRAALQEYVSSLSDKLFFKVHRSYAVNLLHIDNVNTDYVTVKGNKIPLSRLNRNELMERLKIR